MARSDELRAQYESALAEERALDLLREARVNINRDPIAAKNAAMALRLARADSRMDKSMDKALAERALAENEYGEDPSIDNAGALIQASAFVHRLERLKGQVDASVSAGSASGGSGVSVVNR
jgi:hypothetical protein